MKEDKSIPGRLVCLFLDFHFFILPHPHFLHLSAFPSVFPPFLKVLVKCLPARKKEIAFCLKWLLHFRSRHWQNKKEKKKGNTSSNIRSFQTACFLGLDSFSSNRTKIPAIKNSSDRVVTDNLKVTPLKLKWGHSSPWAAHSIQHTALCRKKLLQKDVLGGQWQPCPNSPGGLNAGLCNSKNASAEPVIATANVMEHRCRQSHSSLIAPNRAKLCTKRNTNI